MCFFKEAYQNRKGVLSMKTADYYSQLFSTLRLRRHKLSAQEAADKLAFTAVGSAVRNDLLAPKKAVAALEPGDDMGRLKAIVDAGYSLHAWTHDGAKGEKFGKNAELSLYHGHAGNGIKAVSGTRVEVYLKQR